MTKDKKKISWEEEFDYTFVSVDDSRNFGITVCPKDIKQFISTLLNQQKKEIKEKIKKIKKSYDKSKQAIDDILNEL